MRRDHDDAARILATLAKAHAERRPLAIIGSGSKASFARPVDGNLLSIADHTGVLDYRPDELVLTARAGTPLVELERALAHEGQMLPFEPPRFGGGGTFGGALAVGLAGPGRPWYGSVRDAVLGIEIATGEGKRLRFGGQVMKNVAGFDVSRLMVGAQGALGVILSASVKLLPRPMWEATRIFELDREAALARVVAWGRSPEPITATAAANGQLWVRLSGSPTAVAKAAKRLGGEDDRHGLEIWSALRDHAHPFLRKRPLWRLSLPLASAYPRFEADWLTEWGGGQRWAMTEASDADVHEATRRGGGHARPFHDGNFVQPLSPVALRYHRRLKAVFDPHRILNPGRLHAEL